MQTQNKLGKNGLKMKSSRWKARRIWRSFLSCVISKIVGLWIFFRNIIFMTERYRRKIDQTYVNKHVSVSIIRIYLLKQCKKSRATMMFQGRKRSPLTYIMQPLHSSTDYRYSTWFIFASKHFLDNPFGEKGRNVLITVSRSGKLNHTADVCTTLDVCKQSFRQSQNAVNLFLKVAALDSRIPKNSLSLLAILNSFSFIKKIHEENNMVRVLLDFIFPEKVVHLPLRIHSS